MTTTNVHLAGIYRPSEDIVAREIEGEIIIVPLVSGIGDLGDELYALNETGKQIWKLFDGNHSLQDIANILAEQYEAGPGEIEADTIGLTGELLRRRILVEETF